METQNTPVRTQKDARVLLQETIDAYAPDPRKLRAISKDGLCLYKTWDGLCCAVGRCMRNPAAAQRKFGQEWVSFINSTATLDTLLKKQYRGYSIKLWKFLQSLHDDMGNWTSAGLSEDGKTYVENTKFWITNNMPKAA